MHDDHIVLYECHIHYVVSFHDDLNYVINSAIESLIVIPIPLAIKEMPFSILSYYS